MPCQVTKDEEAWYWVKHQVNGGSEPTWEQVKVFMETHEQQHYAAWVPKCKD